MASSAQLAFVIGFPNFPNKLASGFCRSFCLQDKTVVSIHRHRDRRRRRLSSFAVTCSAANKPSSSSQISSTAKIRSEVLSPFRSARMFFYLAFIANAGLGGLIALTQLISALNNPSRAQQVPDILNGLGIDVGAVSVFAFMYARDNKAKNAQVARLSREEFLSNLKVRVDEKRIIPVSSLRGITRIVVLAGPASFVSESFKLSEPFTKKLLNENAKELTYKRRRLWQLAPVYVNEWNEKCFYYYGVVFFFLFFLFHEWYMSGWPCQRKRSWLPTLECFCCTATTSAGHLVRSSRWNGWKSSMKTMTLFFHFWRIKENLLALKKPGLSAHYVLLIEDLDCKTDLHILAFFILARHMPIQCHRNIHNLNLVIQLMAQIKV